MSVLLPVIPDVEGIPVNQHGLLVVTGVSPDTMAFPPEHGQRGLADTPRKEDE
ncbi:TPA: hypothetical protein ACIBS5_003256 [Salmonella enterica subsp. diarizonae serovar 60-67:z35:-]